MTALSYSPLAKQLRETFRLMSSPRIYSYDFIGHEAGERPSNASIIDLPRIPDPRGNLTFVEENGHVPFDIKRVFYLYDVPGGADRGGHAHRDLHQLVIAVAGSFDVLLDDGERVEKFSLNRSYYGLHIPPMRWGELENFSSGAVCLVLASEKYDESDYYRDYDAFLDAARRKA